ncbi:MAG: GHKL domain-containing protein, partial [Clostridia bacterium]|nr:GHKL domain-containing protein [Clostridia bacterium]
VTGLLPYVASISQYMAYAVCFVLLFMLIIIYYLTRGITKPLEDMQEVTRHIAKGEFNYRASEDYKQKDINDFAKQLNKMAYELAIDDESRKSFVANVSHELKTPMTTIGGFIDGILDGTIPPEEEKKYLGVVSNEVKRLARMVVSMLNLSKIESGEVPLSPVEYDIGKQVFETMLSFEKKIYENNIEIEGFEEINNVLIKADRDLVQQVLYNLLDNAVKFTPENGTIHIFASNDGKKTYVKIRNSGAGVAPEEISRIFERFYKVDKSRSYDVKGVGLGLYIVKTIINMHDGEISASSKQGEYTEFAFEIPFDQ